MNKKLQKQKVFCVPEFNILSIPTSRKAQVSPLRKMIMLVIIVTILAALTITYILKPVKTLEISCGNQVLEGVCVESKAACDELDGTSWGEGSLENKKFGCPTAKEYSNLKFCCTNSSSLLG